MNAENYLKNWVSGIQAALRSIGSVLLLGAAAAVADDFQGATHLMPFDEETINYSKQKDTGPVAQLQAKIDRGELKMKHGEKFGYLPSLLEALGVSTNSQMLVFSKTSFQRERIAPRTPRPGSLRGRPSGPPSPPARTLLVPRPPGSRPATLGGAFLLPRDH